jgi:hydrogenase nickel incorporation protein HypA/HybF
MHELSVAESIFRLAEEKIAPYKNKKTVQINLQIGLLSGIDFDALDFAISSVIKDTVFEHVLINIEKIKPLAKCSQCQLEFEPEDYITCCPKCGSLIFDFLKGRELFIRSIELEETE